MRLLLFISLIMMGCNAKEAAATEKQSTGTVIKIVDGDTYDILFDDKTTERIRMEGIDAPERGMAFYKVSKDYLGALCFGQTIRIERTNRDRYGRTVAKTFLGNGNELGFLMIQAGYAWHFKKYSADAQLANAEIEARNKRIGLWVDETPIAPWENRKK